MTITRRIEIDAGHRLLKHEGRCAHPHGHRYAFEVTVAPTAPLDAAGRVVDFGVVKELVGGWLDRAWDHAFIVQRGDPLETWLRDQRCRHYVLADPPSAEHLAACVFAQAQVLLGGRLTVVRVRCYETPSCWADADG